MIKKKCIVCGKGLHVKKSHADKGWGKYCSKKCQAKMQVNGKWLECDHCGRKIYRTPKDFKRSKSKKFFCSVRCHCSWENKYKRCGENAPNWRTGQTSYRALLKRCGKPEICAQCSNDDHRVLVVHHRDSNRKNNKPENLEWLCRNCHCIVHLD
jgi:HNH endonuclease